MRHRLSKFCYCTLKSISSAKAVFSRNKMKSLIVFLDFVILLGTIKGIDSLASYYVPWEARPTVDTGERTNVRAGPSTSYDILFKLPIKPKPAKAKIIGEVNDWYRLISEHGAPCAECKFKTDSQLDEQCEDLGPGEVCEPGGMARKDTMKKIPTKQPDIIRVVSFMLHNPPWPVFAICLLWFWPRIRSWLWNERYTILCQRIKEWCSSSDGEQQSNATSPVGSDLT